MLFNEKKYSGNFAARKFRKFTEIFLIVYKVGRVAPILSGLLTSLGLAVNPLAGSGGQSPGTS